MVREFKIGQNALDVCKVIVDHNPDISILCLASHEVVENWGQCYKTKAEKLDNIVESFEHPKSISIESYSRDQFSHLQLEELYNLEENQVWSINSKIISLDGQFKHIPMMNFHSNGVSLEHLKKAINYIAEDKPGVILETERFHHYYGDFLLDELKWIEFMAEFLMPCTLVSQRYIGHRLYDGYCSLRLTTDDKYKPEIPKVIEIM